jgi:AMMECR1 domain-containing protein
MATPDGRRGVFLPDVWSHLPRPDDFLDHLLLKAAIRPGTWPEGMQAWRFTTRKAVRRLERRAVS